MNGPQLKSILNEIKSQKGDTITAIAKVLGISQPHLSTVCNSDAPVSADILLRMTKKYPDFMKSQGIDLPKLAPDDISLVQVQGLLDALLYHYADHVAAVTGRRAGEVVREVLDEAKRNLINRRK